MRMSDLPVACSLTPDAINARRAGLLPGLARQAVRRERLSEGLRLIFTADAFPSVAATVDAERACCRFLRFDIQIEPGGGAVQLSMTGPAGTREFLAALLDS